jgi:N-methylhydantoinase A
MGLLVTDLKREYTTTLLKHASETDPAALTDAFQALEDQGGRDLQREGVSEERTTFVRQIDMRYVGQSYELAVTVSAGVIDRGEIDRIISAFHHEHERAYGHSSPEESTEFVNLRVTAIGEIDKPRLHELETFDESPARALKGERPVYFAETEGFVDCAVYDRYGLGAGMELEGPAIVEEFDTTTVVHPGYRAKVDRHGNLLLSAT